MSYLNRRNSSDRPTEHKRYWMQALSLTLVLVVVVTATSCFGSSPLERPLVDDSTPQTVEARTSEATEQDTIWTPPELHAGRTPVRSGSVQIKGIGSFSFEAQEVRTVRPDIFRTGHFSLFDVLVHLDALGQIKLGYHFDETLDTHVIESIDGESGWWYEAYYSGGWFERNSFRMDMYPYKDGTTMRLSKMSEEHLANIHLTFSKEVDRLASNGGAVIIPRISIRSPSGEWSFEDVEVTAHDVRNDMLQPGVVTGLDALISLVEQGELSHLKLTWYESVASANPTDSFWVERINDAVAQDSCGFVYETGATEFSGFSGSHIHIPSDVRVTVSPEYALWFWICL